MVRSVSNNALRLACGLAVAVLVSSPARAAVDDARTADAFAITLHVATEDVEHARAHWERSLAKANTAFGPAGFRFYVAERRDLPQSRATLDNLPERHGLKRRLVRGTINVFVVDVIRDPRPSRSAARALTKMGRRPKRRLSGTHIGTKGNVEDAFLVVSLQSDTTTLAHELGHFFGAGHEQDPSNLMGYGHDRRVFDGVQLRAFRRRADQLRSSGELRTLATR